MGFTVNLMEFKAEEEIFDSVLSESTIDKMDEEVTEHGTTELW